MPIRLATVNDLPEILAIYQEARTQMRKNNNPTQWGKNHPAKAVILADIAAKNLYLIYDHTTIGGVFAFICGEDPTYRHIDGKWLNTAPYGTIHRIAGNGRIPHIFEQALTFCTQLEPNIKIDTHQNNQIMRHLITKNGFKYCGIIQTDDGSDRLAYQKSC